MATQYQLSSSKLRFSKNLVIPQDLHRQMKHAAVDLDRTVGEVATEAAADWIKKYQEQKELQPA